MTRMPRVLIALTSHGQLGTTGRTTGFYLFEASHTWKVLVDAGFQVDLVSVQGGQPPMDDAADTTDPVQRAFLDDPRMAAQLPATPRPDGIDPADYDAILYMGGHGTMWDFPDNADLAALGRGIYEAGGVVAAVCHGPAALVNLTLSDGRHLVDGKNIAAFTDAEENAVGLTGVVPFLLQSTLEQRGAKHTGADNFAPHVVVDERLVTGQNPASTHGVGEAVVHLLRASTA